MPSSRSKSPKKRSRSYNLYVIELDPRVLICPRFRKANPNKHPGKPCVYVGSTVHTPEERFRQHRAGYKANRYARRYGLRLCPELYRHFQGYRTRERAEQAESRAAERLRKRGWAVWYGV